MCIIFNWKHVSYLAQVFLLLTLEIFLFDFNFSSYSEVSLTLKLSENIEQEQEMKQKHFQSRKDAKEKLLLYQLSFFAKTNKWLFQKLNCISFKKLKYKNCFVDGRTKMLFIHVLIILIKDNPFQANVSIRFNIVYIIYKNIALILLRYSEPVKYSEWNEVLIRLKWSFPLIVTIGKKIKLETTYLKKL